MPVVTYSSVYPVHLFLLFFFLDKYMKSVYMNMKILCGDHYCILLWKCWSYFSFMFKYENIG
ncbi:hypothetical protein BDB01DRAFT_813470 [Pilobolus umbonatus]|nr:hypothetical protein BDB01DRAFT_813470 [Pilobolus umbonatus]